MDNVQIHLNLFLTSLAYSQNGSMNHLAEPTVYAWTMWYLKNYQTIKRNKFKKKVHRKLTY